MDSLPLTKLGLTHNGFPCQWEGKDTFVTARIEFIRAVIRVSIAPAKSYGVGSYGGKHYVERLSGSYVSNGEFIVAMLLEGYTHSKVIAGSPNVSFKAKYLASNLLVANFPHQSKGLPEPVLVRHWGKKPLAAYREVLAHVKAIVDSTKQDKERVEEVIGHV